MKLNEYQELAMRTKNNNIQGFDLILNAALGMAGESGEIIEHLKKHMFQGHELDLEKLKKETGDLMWYCAEMAEGLRTTLEFIAEGNIEKLKKRYPDGFDKEKSINREMGD